MDEEEGKGHSFITDRIKNTVESTKCPDGGDIAMEIHTSKTKLKAQKTAENKPKITIDIKSHGDIGEVNCSMDLTNPQTIKEVEKLFEKEITKIVKKVLTKTQEENKVDSFGIGQVIRASYPKIWEEMKDDWGEHFAALDIEVKVDVTVRETGEIIDPVKKQFKE